MLQISYHRNKCIGCNACVEAAPERWRVSRRDGKSTLIGGKAKKGVFVASVHEGELLDNEKAAKNCPVNIIKLKII